MARIIRKVKNLWDVLEQVQKVAEILLVKLWILLDTEVTVPLAQMTNEKRGLRPNINLNQLHKEHTRNELRLPNDKTRIIEKITKKKYTYIYKIQFIKSKKRKKQTKKQTKRCTG